MQAWVARTLVDVGRTISSCVSSGASALVCANQIGTCGTVLAWTAGTIIDICANAIDLNIPGLAPGCSRCRCCCLDGGGGGGGGGGRRR